MYLTSAETSSFPEPIINSDTKAAGPARIRQKLALSPFSAQPSGVARLELRRDSASRLRAQPSYPAEQP